jgi:hypothetical protein
MSETYPHITCCVAASDSPADVTSACEQRSGRQQPISCCVFSKLCGGESVRFQLWSGHHHRWRSHCQGTTVTSGFLRLSFCLQFLCSRPLH